LEEFGQPRKEIPDCEVLIKNKGFFRKESKRIRAESFIIE
jgi:hypothetical protein